jgi:hypothetical protein
VPTLASETAKAENDPDRTNWWGRKINKTSYFEAAPAPSAESAESASPVTAEPAPPPRDFQTIRSVADYLPQPVWPSDVVPDASRPAERQRYDHDSVLLLLKAARAANDYNLLQRILEVSVAEAFASDSAWLAVYLATPPAERTNLPRPGRISPEWFATVLAEYTTAYDRHAARCVPLLERVVAWTAEKAELICAAETAHSEFTVVNNRVVLPRPDMSPKALRFLRNRRGFIAPDYLARLYRDLDEFAGFLPRAGFQNTRRKGWKKAAKERKQGERGEGNPGE